MPHLKIKPLFLYCSYWHTFWKRVLHKKKEAISFLKDISFINAQSEVNVCMEDTSLDLRLNSLLEATFSMFILFTFPPYDRSNKYREERSDGKTHYCYIQEVTYSHMCTLLHYKITRETQWHIEDSRTTIKRRKVGRDI